VIINGREVRPRVGGQVIVAGELQPVEAGPAVEAASF
jgi:hypothetical protein